MNNAGYYQMGPLEGYQHGASPPAYQINVFNIAAARPGIPARTTRAAA